jgi:hypothetical protein
MAFSEETKGEAFTRSGGQCECRRSNCPVHPQSERCSAKVTRKNATYRHIVCIVDERRHDSLMNCEVLCMTCYTAPAYKQA